MRLKTIYVPIILGMIFFLGIGMADVAGVWKIESEKVPMSIKEGEFAGLSDPEDIRGSYSFGDIAASFDIEASLIAEAFGIDSDLPEDILCKDLEAIFSNIESDLELGTGSVKQFVALYTGLPFEGDDGFPSTAIAVLEREGKWSEALEASLEGRIIEVGHHAVAGTSAETNEASKGDGSPNPSVEEHAESIGVKGKTTILEVIDWGLTMEEVEEVFGVPIEREQVLIRDLCTELGLSFGEVKVEINTLLGVEE